MAPLRFSANVSWLFPELPGLPERLQAAGRAGFEAAEVAWPYAEPPQALASAARAAGLKMVLINTPRGDQEKGEMGLGAVPGRQAAFREGLEQAVLYAKALGCPRIHLMAGRVPPGADRAAVKAEMETVFLENLRHAAGVLAQENLVGLLEPINTRITDPQYFLDTPQQAAAILQKVGRPNLQLQMVSGRQVLLQVLSSGLGRLQQTPAGLMFSPQDLFHWQIMDGNLTGNIRKFLPIVGHVQVAQVPDRGEPGSSGELDFAYLFQLLEDEGYQGFVGCEYRPQGDTVEGLSWLRSYWDRRGHPRSSQ
ncbi:putative hydroxypyruvate isomerase isoform X1 [Microtus ochrogaster]|uniref:Putative hydroxypyruvate isomerase n=1 Tax=Microtus ochrogaster TaxID=79684 RepID=A0ABM1AXQ3_MICOH|nr:putative hydroxypyruvate isomerase isoform X1 [Microtus ochrogaster]